MDDSTRVNECIDPCKDAERATCNAAQKRLRSPLWPVVVADYRPYGGGQLRQCYDQRRGEHADHWNCYYRNNTINGYKDRHYILREFHELRRRIESAVSLTDVNDAKGESNRACDGDVPLPLLESAECGAGCHSTARTCAPFSWLEAGCGVGNAMLPIFEEYGHLPQWRAMFGFDISAVAIDLLERKKKERLPAKLAAKLHVCVLNPCEQPVTECSFFRASRDASLPQVTFVSLIFVLCSIPVESHLVVLRRLAACMSPYDGALFFRDYAASDLAESRFRKRLKGDRSRGRCAGMRTNPTDRGHHSGCLDETADSGTAEENASKVTDKNNSNSSITTAAGDDDVNDEDDASTFRRSNGTLSHFFQLEDVDHLFTEAGFATIELVTVHRDVTNHKAGTTLSRRFVQGRFRLKSTPSSVLG